MDGNFLNYTVTEVAGNEPAYSQHQPSTKKMRVALDVHSNGTMNGRTPRTSVGRKTPRGTSRGRNKFQDSWLHLPEFKDWLSRVPGDLYSSHCTVCCTLLKNYSKSELQKHGRGKRHLENLGAKLQDPSYFLMANPKLELGEATTSSDAESVASPEHYNDMGNNSSTTKGENRFVTFNNLAEMLLGPLSFNYISEIPYFSGNYKEESLTIMQWFRRFERVALLAGWDAPTKLKILPLRLKGIMEDVFTCIENEYAHTLTYEIARQRMIERVEQR